VACSIGRSVFLQAGVTTITLQGGHVKSKTIALYILTQNLVQ